MLMKILRWFGLTLALAVFSFFLWILAVDLGVVHELSNPNNIKKIVAESGIYNNVLTTALSQKDDQGNPTTIKIDGDEVATNDPLIIAAANRALPPSLIQQNVEQVIDSFNAWTNSQTATPQFKVDLTAAKADFASDVASGLQAKLASLPACTDGTTVATFNPFTSSCIPNGTTPAATATAVQNNLTSSREFFKNPVFTANDIKDKNGQSVFASDQARSGRSNYDQIKASPVFLAILALLMAVVIFFISSSRRKGIRRIGIVLVINGCLILLFTVLINSGINRITPSDTNPNIKSFEESGIKAGKALVQDLNRTYYPLGGVYSGLGIAMIIGSIVVRRRGGSGNTDKSTVHKPTILDDDERPEPDEVFEDEKPSKKPEPAAKPATAAKPKSQPKAKSSVKKIKVS